MTMKEMMGHLPNEGVVTLIQIRPERNAQMVRLREVQAESGLGLAGDRYGQLNGARQVTLIQEEHLEAVASFLDRESVDPALTRRNLVVRGINLLSLKEKRFQIGSAILEYSGECHPCSRMETNLGYGGYNAMRGHGGITARVITTGRIAEGDAVKHIGGYEKSRALKPGFQ